MAYCSKWMGTAVLPDGITDVLIGRRKIIGQKAAPRGLVRGNIIDAHFQANRPMLSDRQWVEEQFRSVPSGSEGYTDAQFMADLRRASQPLEERAERARRSMAQGTSKQFPK